MPNANTGPFPKYVWILLVRDRTLWTRFGLGTFRYSSPEEAYEVMNLMVGANMWPYEEWEVRRTIALRPEGAEVGCDIRVVDI